MKTLNEASVLAMTTEAGAMLLLFLVPVLAIATWLILRATRRFSQEAEAIVRSSEETSVAAWFERNGPALIRRIGPDGRQPRLPGNPQSTLPLFEGDGETIDMEEVPEEADDDYGRQGVEEEMKVVLQMEPKPEPAPATDQDTNENDLESEFKPLGT